MRWDKARRSDNVIDSRGRSGRGGGGGGGKLGLAGIAIVVVLGLISGEDPMRILSRVLGQLDSSTFTTQQSAPPPASQAQDVDFVRAILGDTEDTWQALFAQSNEAYRFPKLELFRNGVNSACGYAQSAVGPFYCPADQKIYLDLQFFDDMERQFAASGDFARAYVIAHEVGHHVQTLLGVSAKVNRARQQGQRVEGDNGLLVRQELQADCLAGVWAYHAQQRHQWLEAGDVDDALRAANAIGDDRLQQQAQGRVVPDAFTHGTSAQRVKWFKAGLNSGDPNRCDTFSTKNL